MHVKPTAASDRLSTREACEHLTVSRTTLYGYLKRDPGFPRPFKLSERALRWSRAELDAWIESKRAA